MKWTQKGCLQYDALENFPMQIFYGNSLIKMFEDIINIAIVLIKQVFLLFRAQALSTILHTKNRRLVSAEASSPSHLRPETKMRVN